MIRFEIAVCVELPKETFEETHYENRLRANKIPPDFPLVQWGKGSLAPVRFKS